MNATNKTGLIQVFTGNGKGKSTAAMGTAVRAAGHGLKAHIIFFMKGDYPYGEYRSLPSVEGINIESFGFRTLTNPAKIKPEEIEQAEAALTAAGKAVASGDYDIVVLDEANVAVSLRLISLDGLLTVIENKASHTELIITGRYAEPRLLEKADLVTEMVKVKHPFDTGVKARRGIEF